MTYSDPYLKGFMDCLASEKKGVFVRHVFVDINDGNLSDAVLFSQCAFIFAQINDGGYRHYSLINYQGALWISISYAQWWDTCRLNKSTVRAIIKRVEDRGLIVTDMIRENNSPRTILRINYAKFTELLQGQEGEKQVIESITSPDRIDRLQVIESITSPDRIDHVSISKEYLEELERSNQQDPECAIEIKACQVEIVLEEEQTEAPHPLALNQTGNALTVNGLKKGEDKFSATGRAALVSSVAAEMAVKVDATTIVCDDMGHNGFNGFRDKYQLLATSVRRKFGRMDDAKAAWRAAWKGFEPPEAFWKGLDCYYEQQQDEYLRKGECWMVGAKRFLDPEERHWEAAITSHQVDRQAQAFGVDMNNPAEVKTASLLSSNLRNWEIAKQQMILKGVAI